MIIKELGLLVGKELMLLLNDSDVLLLQLIKLPLTIRNLCLILVTAQPILILLELGLKLLLDHLNLGQLLLDEGLMLLMLLA